jgi:hypothetical protein
MLMRTTLMLRETVGLIGGAAHLFSACGRNDNWKSLFFFFFILPRRSILKKKFTNFRETTDEREYLLPGTGVKSATLETAIA